MDEQFNNRIFKLKKHLTDITFDLNKLSNRNHSTIARIIDNLNTMSNPSQPPSKILDKSRNNKHTYKASTSTNHFKKKIGYTKNSVSLEKNNFYIKKSNNFQNNRICLSATNINQNKDNNKQNSEYSVSNYMDKNRNAIKKKIYIKNDDDIINDLILNNNKTENKYSDLSNKNRNRKNGVFPGNNNENCSLNINKYNTLDDNLFFDKKNPNEISNYKDKNCYKNDIEKKYFYDYNLPNTYLCNGYKELYDESSSSFNPNYENEKNYSTHKNNTIYDYKTLQNMNFMKPKGDIFDMNINKYNPSSNKMTYNNINKNENYYNNSKKIKTNLFKRNKAIVKNNNICNSRKINSFRERTVYVNNKNIYHKKNVTNERKKAYIYNNKMIRDIIQSLEVKDLTEAISKIKTLKNYQKFYNEIQKIYCKYNTNNNENIKNENNSNNIFFWLNKAFK